eukprot:scaffold125206_cov18-Tisochrysis_lutea.AAC.1
MESQIAAKEVAQPELAAAGVHVLLQCYLNGAVVQHAHIHTTTILDPRLTQGAVGGLIPACLELVIEATWLI